MKIVDKFSSLKKEVDSLNSRFSELKLDIATTESNLKNEIKKMNSTIPKDIIKKKELQDVALILENKIKKLEKESSNVEKEISNLSSEIKKKNYKELKMDLLTTEENLKNLIKKVENKIPRDIVDKKEFRDTIELLSKRIKNLEEISGDIEGMKEGFIKLKKEVDLIEEKFSKLGGTRKDINDIIKKVNEIEDVYKKISSFEKNYSLLNKDFQNVKFEVEKINKEIKNLKDVKVDIVTTSTGLKEQIGNINQKIKDIQAKKVSKDELLSESSKLDERIEVVYKDINTKISEVEKIGNKLKEINDIVDRKMKEMEQKIDDKTRTFEDRLEFLEEGFEKEMKKEINEEKIEELRDKMEQNRKQIKTIEDAVVEINLTLRKVLKLI